jgi:hypothetical protein
LRAIIVFLTDGFTGLQPKTDFNAQTLAPRYFQSFLLQ